MNGAWRAQSQHVHGIRRLQTSIPHRSGHGIPDYLCGCLAALGTVVTHLAEHSGSAGERDQGPWCPRCGYSLCGLTLPRRCPECGTPVNHANAITLAPRLRRHLALRRLTRILPPILVAAALLWVGPGNVLPCRVQFEERYDVDAADGTEGAVQGYMVYRRGTTIVWGDVMLPLCEKAVSNRLEGDSSEGPLHPVAEICWGNSPSPEPTGSTTPDPIVLPAKTSAICRWINGWLKRTQTRESAIDADGVAYLMAVILQEGQPGVERLRRAGNAPIGASAGVHMSTKRIEPRSVDWLISWAVSIALLWVCLALVNRRNAVAERVRNGNDAHMHSQEHGQNDPG